MQCKEWDDANSELFKESHDEAVHKNSCKSRLYELISASLGRDWDRDLGGAFQYSRRLMCTSCIGCASRPKLALSLPIKGPSFRLTDRTAGEVRRSRIGGGERSEPVSRMVFMSYDTESKSRNADFISIARKGNPTPSEPFSSQPFYTTCGASRAPFYKICGVSRHHPPFEPFEPFEPSEPSEPSRRRRVQRACQKISKTLLTQTPIHGIIIPVAARAAAPRSSSSKTFQKSA